MSNLNIAKATLLEQFKSALSPNTPSPQQLTTVEMINRPIVNLGVVSEGAYDVIQGMFKPGDIASWSTADSFPTAYINMVENMAYGLSTQDQNRIKDLETKNQVTLNNLVNTYEQTYSRITDEQLQVAGVQTKIDYVVSKVDDLKKSFNWAKFAPDYNSASADIDIISNINSAKVEFAKQISAIKNNIANPSATNGGTQKYDNNNNKVWAAGYNVDQNFPSRFENGEKVTVVIEIDNFGTDSSSFSINGHACGSFGVGFLGISGSTSAEYNQSDFRSLMSKVKITLEYDNVSYLAASPSGLDVTNTVGWYLPSILKQAYENTADTTGPYFVTNSAAMKQQLTNKELQSVVGFLVSTAPSGTMEFASDDYSSFQKYFHTQSHASVSLFGFIPVAGANTSYTKSSSGSSDHSTGMTVQLNASKDKNNLVIHGVSIEDPLS